MKELKDNIGEWHNPDNVPAENLEPGSRFCLPDEKCDGTWLVWDRDKWRPITGSCGNPAQQHGTMSTTSPILLRGEWSRWALQWRTPNEWLAVDSLDGGWLIETTTSTPESCFLRLQELRGEEQPPKPPAYMGCVTPPPTIQALDHINECVVQKFESDAKCGRLEAECAELRQRLETSQNLHADSEQKRLGLLEVVVERDHLRAELAEAVRLRETGLAAMKLSKQRADKAESALAALRKELEKGNPFTGFNSGEVCNASWNEWRTRILANHSEIPNSSMGEATYHGCDVSRKIDAQTEKVAAELKKPDLSDEAFVAWVGNELWSKEWTFGERESARMAWRACRERAEGSKT